MRTEQVREINTRISPGSSKANRNRSGTVPTHSANLFSRSSIPLPSKFQIESVSKLRHLIKAANKEIEFEAKSNASFSLRVICPRKTKMLT